MRALRMLVLVALATSAPVRADVAAGCGLFGKDTTYTALRDWPHDVVRLLVPWRPFCTHFSCVRLPNLVGANVRQAGNTITVDMYGSDDALPDNILIRPPSTSLQGPVAIDVGPLAPGTYTVQGTANAVTAGAVSNACTGLMTFTTFTIEQASGPVERQTVIEFHHLARDHYFMSSDPAEIAALDNGTHAGWSRTGKSFAVFAPGKSGGVGVPVCRFYGAPEAGLDSHFYTANAAECAALPGQFGGAWQLETGEAFDVRLPEAEGACAGGFIPVYRLWNNRADSNHRFTTDPFVVGTMRNKGWRLESAAPEGASMCSPP